ncbi:probable transcription factor At3g04930 [Typha latifolia]|uniref:probable transcription factor At3g04930 n=1 Tax=Typha latifolia TaxID=4733 RepID=UPI003C2EB15C
MQKTGKDFAFKSSHEQEIYEIARNIWNTGIKRAHDSDDENDVKPSNNPNSGDSKRFRKRSVEDSGTVVPVMVTEENPIPTSSSAMITGVIEETVRSCLSPLFKELINSAIGGGQVGGDFGLLGLNPLPLCLDSNLANTSGPPVEEKWRKQQIMELEVYLKRIELVKEQIKSKLEELNSSGS